MEELRHKVEKSPDVILIEQVREDLLNEKNINLEKREKGAAYYADSIDLNLNLVGIEEARLFNKIKNINSKEDFKKVNINFNAYRNKVLEEMQKDKDDGKFKGEVFDYPKGIIASILGNRLTKFINEFS